MKLPYKRIIIGEAAVKPVTKFLGKRFCTWTFGLVKQTLGMLDIVDHAPIYLHCSVHMNTEDF